MKTATKLIAIIVMYLNFSCTKDDTAIVDTKLVLPTILSNNIELIIPDCTGDGIGKIPGMASSTIEITSDGIIADPSKIILELDLSHTFAGDIIFELIAPSGENCGIIKRIGTTTDTSAGSSKDFIKGNKLKFNSLHTTFILPQAELSIPAGNYAPSRGISSIPFSIPVLDLKTFLMNKNIKGIWTVKVHDFSTADTGKLNSWKLYFDAGALQ